MIKGLIHQIFHITIWIIIAMSFLYIFFKLTTPQNSITYDFSNATYITVDGIAFFSDTNSEMKISFDSSNIENKTPCYFIIEFTNENGKINLADMEQEKDNKILFNDTFEGDYNKENNCSQTVYFISFYPQDQDNSIVNFWGGVVHNYSVLLSLTEKELSKQENIEFLSQTIDNQYVQNEVKLNNGIMEITGILGMFELSNFLIYEAKLTNEGIYIVTDIFDFYDTRKYISLSDYKLSYRIDDKEFNNGANTMNSKNPITLIYRSDIEHNKEITIRGIKKFTALNSEGTLLRYTTANPVEYKVDKQEVVLYSKNYAADESRVTLGFDFSEISGSSNGTVNIIECDGTIAGKTVVPQFLDWFYGNYYAIALAVFSVIIGNFVMKNNRKNQNVKPKE